MFPHRATCLFVCAYSFSHISTHSFSRPLIPYNLHTKIPALPFGKAGIFIAFYSAKYE